jgi:hypothetical protein
MYKEFGESLPFVEQYTRYFQDKNLPHMHKILESIFLDLLRFHHMAFKFFKQKRKAPVEDLLFRSADKGSLEADFPIDMENLSHTISVHRR